MCDNEKCEDRRVPCEHRGNECMGPRDRNDDVICPDGATVHDCTIPCPDCTVPADICADCAHRRPDMDPPCVHGVSATPPGDAGAPQACDFRALTGTVPAGGGGDEERVGECSVCVRPDEHGCPSMNSPIGDPCLLRAAESTVVFLGERVEELEGLAHRVLRADGTTSDRCCACGKLSEDDDGHHYVCRSCNRPVCEPCEERMEDEVMCPDCHAFHCRCSTCGHWSASEGKCKHPSAGENGFYYHWSTCELYESPDVEKLRATIADMTPVYDLAVRLVNECPMLVLSTVCKHNDEEGCPVACLGEDLVKLVKEKP